MISFNQKSATSRIRLAIFHDPPRRATPFVRHAALCGHMGVLLIVLFSHAIFVIR